MLEVVIEVDVVAPLVIDVVDVLDDCDIVEDLLTVVVVEMIAVVEDEGNCVVALVEFEKNVKAVDVADVLVCDIVMIED